MKSIKLLVFLGLFLSSGQIFGGLVLTIEYAPTNPTAGQPVTFTLIGNEGCGQESLVPDAQNNVGNLLPFPGDMPNSVMYTYPTGGIYHVGLDLNYDECLRDEIKKTDRELASNFQMGPVGGPYTQAVMQGEIFCSPITVAAAPAPIPTMGQWSIIILSILTSIVGVVFAMNRITTKAQV